MSQASANVFRPYLNAFESFCKSKFEGDIDRTLIEIKKEDLSVYDVLSSFQSYSRADFLEWYCPAAHPLHYCERGDH